MAEGNGGSNGWALLSTRLALRHVELVLSDLAFVLLLPPVNLALLAAVGTALAWSGRGRAARIGSWLAAAGLALLLLLALPAVSGALLAALEAGLPAAAPAQPPQAIIILGGDEVTLWPSLQAGVPAVDIGGLSLARLRGGAALARATHLPVLITGGVLSEGGAPIAVLMARSMVADFGVPVRWIEPAASDTWENARFSAALLRRAGIRTAYVVTHAWHMRRALLAFAQTGLVATPAPLTLEAPFGWHGGAFLPRVASWQRSYFALHEWIGCAWYAWRAHRS